MKNILEYLEQVCQCYPDRVAIEEPENSITFSELKLQAQMVANEIKKHNIKNVTIGVMADRKIETVVLFLGTLYSKNTYVALNPEMPEEKFDYIVQANSFPIILGSDNNNPLAQKYQDRYINYKWRETTFSSDLENLEIKTPEIPMNIVYTSGSTGVPKGVVKSHAAMISYIEAFCKTFIISNEEVIGNQTPFYFDASAKDIYLMLKTGAKMVIIPTQLFATPWLLVEYMNTKKVTTINWVPSALSIISKLNIFDELLPEYLTKVFFVGEAFQVKQLKKWQKALPDISYINLYGSSEMAGVCCYYIVEDNFEKEALPIGKPLCNSQIFLVDETNNVITESGVTGEICIESLALADGYYQDQETTDKVFKNENLGGENKRIFHSGDLAYYDEENNLVFAARKDFQIKHMGYRIELEEIEQSALMTDEIKDCGCVYNPKNDKIYLFCAVYNPETTIVDIKNRLKSKLPSYMVPNVVKILDEIPLNANGKTNRQQLKELM